MNHERRNNKRRSKLSNLKFQFWTLGYRSMSLRGLNNSNVHSNQSKRTNNRLHRLSSQAASLWNRVDNLPQASSVGSPKALIKEGSSKRRGCQVLIQVMNIKLLELETVYLRVPCSLNMQRLLRCPASSNRANIVHNNCKYSKILLVNRLTRTIQPFMTSFKTKFQETNGNDNNLIKHAKHLQK